ncbi:hypothetical protein BCR34DRAFT_599145 [Clohesyomyces aquaticus]|uniref:DUF676 domain-containing protein n=1 Tax=Clohesyomyces aquaticus TaxID=1231657 RepID=A0A1Y1ZWI6_9PLEO|nr:hypothetical protein BCR34DRAFT_599145 [Clohesyomyces aquaticus]
MSLDLDLIRLIPSQRGLPSNPLETPIPYTGSPFLLCYLDILRFVQESWSIFGILTPEASTNFDELYLRSAKNILCIMLHAFLFIWQTAFLLSLPFLVLVPVWMGMAYVAGVVGVVAAVCWVLNRRDRGMESKADLGPKEGRHGDECWIYMNGVSVGTHWLQANLDRLALTFRRPVLGVHNRTWGIVFDLVQCIIERNFCYATTDVRNAYSLIKTCLLKDENKKVILILHSQGGIQGGLVLDWLLSELPHDVINKLEIYTFGCAANHFNNPHRTERSLDAATDHKASTRNEKAVRHIEHYANDSEFVARWGVLSFANTQNRYMGRVFVRSGTGHLLNQHYLNNMFLLDANNKVLENNDFMDRYVDFEGEDMAREDAAQTFINGGVGTGGARLVDIQSPVDRVPDRMRVRDFSRLWQYRDGQVPED